MGGCDEDMTEFWRGFIEWMNTLTWQEFGFFALALLMVTTIPFEAMKLRHAQITKRNVEGCYDNLQLIDDRLRQMQLAEVADNQSWNQR